MPRRSEPSNVSRDFWMPDHSCRVCYECDAQFTIFNRRHHCRHCGRIFCGKCTANSVPVLCYKDPKGRREEVERVRVCNFCFKRWEQEMSAIQKGIVDSVSPSLSALSLDSTKSTGMINSPSTILGSHLIRGYENVPLISGSSPDLSCEVKHCHGKQVAIEGKDSTSLDQFVYCMSRYVLNLLCHCGNCKKSRAFFMLGS